MTLIGNRPLRVCDACGQVDDHPRHVISGEANAYPPPDRAILDVVLETAPREHRARLVAELMDQSSLDLHLDCCRERGCPLPAGDPHNCANRTQGAETKRGKALLAHLDREG